MASQSTLRTSPVNWKSTPSMMPTGRAVTKLPEMMRTVECAIGVFGRPWLKAASISRRSSPAASFAHSSAAASVMRKPLWNCASMPLAAPVARSTCGREPCTSTTLMPIAQIATGPAPALAACRPRSARPRKATTKVLPRKRVDVGRDRAEPRHEGDGLTMRLIVRPHRDAVRRELLQQDPRARRCADSPQPRASQPAPPRRAQPLPPIIFPEELPVSAPARGNRARDRARTRSSSSAAKPAPARPRSCRRSPGTRARRRRRGRAADRPYAAAPHRRRPASPSASPRNWTRRSASVVGFKVRFQDRCRTGASVKLMTDGILLAETQTDPLLRHTTR